MNLLHVCQALKWECHRNDNQQLRKAFPVDEHALPKSGLLGFEEDASNCPSWSFLDDIVLSVCPNF